VTATDYGFTGQCDSGWGLYNFKARWFDNNIGRFTQADTIVPGPGNPLAWDRYAGLGNNPVKYIDPSGHIVACDHDDWACQTHWDIPNKTKTDKYTFDIGPIITVTREDGLCISG